MGGSALFMNIKSKIPKESYVFMKEKLESLSDDKQNEITVLDLKDPIIGLVLSLLLGGLGVDRFYRGDIGLGVLKLLTLGGLGIWSIIDWFLIMGLIRKDNLEKINMIL